MLTTMILSGSLSLMVLGLFVYNFSNALKNVTVIESFEADRVGTPVLLFRTSFCVVDMLHQLKAEADRLGHMFRHEWDHGTFNNFKGESVRLVCMGFVLCVFLVMYKGGCD